MPRKHQIIPPRPALPRGLLTPICVPVAAVIRRRRLRAGWSLGQLAQFTKLSRQALSFVESGKRVPTVDTLGRISWAFGIRLSRLLSEAERRAQL